jgi:hypothetical protein
MNGTRNQASGVFVEALATNPSGVTWNDVP